MNPPSAEDRLVKAFGNASKTWDEHYQRPEAGSDLDVYQSLRPEDFPKIATQFGFENTLRYIQTMEHKRMKGG